MDIISDGFGRRIRLTDERWDYIVHKHSNLLQVACTTQRYCFTYVVAVAKISKDGNFVITGYVTDRIKKGTILWEKS